MELLCPDVGVFRCLSFVAERLYSVVVRDVARVVSARYINKGRSPQNCIERGCVSVRSSDAILRDDELICFAYANKIGAIMMAADNTRQRRRNSLSALNGLKWT